ncbi:g1436 [Coccomyxa elongata]
MDSPVTESDDTGVSAALEKIISLESRLRQAIQNSHPLSSSFDRDAASADREREALLAVGGQLEMLEDKLRELRLLALDPREYDDRTVTLSQLDSLRRELIGTAKNNLKYVDFSKDVIKDVIAFAEVNENPSPRDPPLSPIQAVLPSQYTNNTPLRDASPAHSLGKPLDWDTPPRAKRDLRLHAEYLDNFHEPRPLPPDSPAQEDHFGHRSTVPEQMLRHDEADAAERIIGGSGGRSASRSGTKPRTRLLSNPLFAPPQAQSHGRLASEGVHVDDDLYMSTNSSSRYQHDPEYGGKLCLSGWKEAKAGAPQAPQPTPPMPPDHPRVRELAGAETASGPINDAQSEASSASAASWAPAPRSRYVEAATPAKPMPAEGKGSAANRGLVWLLQEGPRFVVAGAVVAAVATGFVKAADGVASAQKQRRRTRPSRLPANERYPAPPFYNTSPTAMPPTGPLFPLQPPPEMPTSRG